MLTDEERKRRQAERNRKYRAAHREELNEQKRKYHAAHREVIKER